MLLAHCIIVKGTPGTYTEASLLAEVELKCHTPVKTVVEFHILSTREHSSRTWKASHSGNDAQKEQRATLTQIHCKICSAALMKCLFNHFTSR